MITEQLYVNQFFLTSMVISFSLYIYHGIARKSMTISWGYNSVVYIPIFLREDTLSSGRDRGFEFGDRPAGDCKN